MREWAILLMGAGAALLLLGAALWLAARFHLPLGRLPGDVHLEGRGWSFSFPVVTCIVASIVLTLLLNLFFRR